MTGAALLMGAAVACAVGGVAEVVAGARRGAPVAGRGAPPGGRRHAGAAAIVRLGRALGPRAPRSLPRRIEAAGLDVPAAEVMAVKAGLAVVALAVAVLLAPAMPGRLAPALLAALPAAAFVLPDVNLRRRTRARGEEMEAELADVLDLLRVAAGAGLTPRRALEETGRRHPGPVAHELRRAAGRAALGVPLAHALRELERRAPADGVHALTAAFQRAETHGAPLDEALHAQAARARSRTAQRTLERAARAAPRIQLVVALVLVPAALLLVAAALLPALAGGRI